MQFRLWMVSVLVALSVVAGAAQGGPLPRKGWFGAAFSPLTPEQRKANNAPETGGLLVGDVVPDGSAAGTVQKGDVLLKIGEKTINAPGDIGATLNTMTTGQKFEVTVLRGGKEQRLTLTLRERPRDKGENYEVLYDHVVSHGHRLRTLVSKPKAPGKRPVMFLIQGIGYSSMDFPLTSQGAYARVLKPFVDKGFVTVRVEKPGLGDSEGGPANTVDYERDLDGFRQALKAIRSYDFVDSDQIFIFGHSMGGCHGPILASETKVRGLAVYGTVTRTWAEYFLENSRRQSLLAGATYASVDTQIRPLLSVIHLLFNEGLEPAAAKTANPKLSAAIDAFTPDGKTMSGMPLPFWRQVVAYNFADYWMKVDTQVLSLWGETEFIASREDHPLIAEIVNSMRPGTARYTLVKESDHAFRKTTSMKHSFETWGRPGPEFNPEVVTVLMAWVDEVRAKK